MGENTKPYPVDYKAVTIRTTDGSTIVGKVNLTNKQRVSDLFTQNDRQFLIMVDVVSRDSAGKILFINKSHIVWAEPED